jgi:hypothetical protein
MRVLMFHFNIIPEIYQTKKMNLGRLELPYLGRNISIPMLGMGSLRIFEDHALPLELQVLINLLAKFCLYTHGSG